MRLKGAWPGGSPQTSDKPGEKPAWRGLGVSVRGTGHIKTGQPCQDAHHWRMMPGPVLVAAVADGAGSATLGDVGARVAATAAVAEMCCQLGLGPPGRVGDDIGAQLVRALNAAREAVAVAAAERSVEERQMATTLILVTATPHLVAATQVGDGAAVVADANGAVSGLTVPQTGEYINETAFLITPGAAQNPPVEVWQGTPAHVAIFSDGLQMLCLKMPEGTPHPPFFGPLFDFVDRAADPGEAQKQLEQFLASPRISENTTDDLTLLLFSLVG